MSRAAFHAAIAASLFRGSLPDWQRAPVDAILDEGIARGRTVREAACVLGNTHHESGRFRFRHEIGRGEGKAYGAAVPLMGTGSRVTATAVYYGRGWIQETWLANLAKLSIRASMHFGREIDLVSHPDRLVEDHALQAWSVWDGFITGRWTGENLAQHTRPDGAVDYFDSRSIVNGDERKALAEPVDLTGGTRATTIGELVRGYCQLYETALGLVDAVAPPAPACPLGRAGCPLAAA